VGSEDRQKCAYPKSGLTYLEVPTMSSGTILIVDDDELVQSSLKAQCQRRALDVLIANDGNEAIRLLERHACDVALLDVLMPDKEGIETLIEIKQRFPKLRVIVMSGGGTRGKYDFLAVARKFGADAVLKKPIRPEELFKAIEARGAGGPVTGVA
jgi:CheY-like chemotaxis protein